MFRTFKAAILALAFATPALAADPVLGTFRTEPGDTGGFAHVEFYTCGASICGVIRKAFDASSAEVASDNVGKRMIWGHMPRRVETDRCVADPKGGAVLCGLHFDLPQTVTHYRVGGVGRKVPTHSGPRMISMTVRYECPVNGTPWVDEKIASRAIDAPVSESEDWT